MAYYQNSKSSLGDLYVSRGDAQFNLKNYEEAISDYRTTLDYYAYTDKQKIYRNLVYAYEQKKYYKEALLCYDSLISMETYSVYLSELYHARAMLKYNMGDIRDDYASILNDMNMTIEKNSYSGEAYYDRGLIQYNKKEFDLARADFKEAVRLFEMKDKTKENIQKLAFSYFSLAGTFHETGKYEDAKASYSKTLQIDSANGYALWNLAKITSDIDKKYHEASLFYQKAQRFSFSKEDQTRFYLNYFFNECKILRYNSALDIINRAIAFDAENPILHWDRGYVYRLKNDYKESIKSYNKALSYQIKDSGQRSSCYLQRGLIKMKLKDVQGALLDIQQSITLYPSYDNYMALGNLFKTGMKQMEIAVGNFQKAIEFTIYGAQRKDTSSNYAYAVAAMGDKKTAERFIKKKIIEASAKMGALASEYHNAACIYTTLGDIPKALTYLELSLQAGYSDYSHMLADLDLEPLHKLPEYTNLLLKYKVPVPDY
jgi:tetratricopeptide (TPR) repeat protein